METSYKLEDLKKRYKQVNDKLNPNKKNKKKKLGFFQLLIPYLRPHLFSWTILIISTIVVSGIAVAIPKLTNILYTDLFHNLIIKKNSGKVLAEETLLYWSIGFGAAFLISGLFRYARQFVSGKLSQKIQIEIRIKILNKLLDYEINYYYNKKKGDILTKLISDTQIIGTQLYQIPMQFLSSIIVFVGSIIVLFTLQNKITSIDPNTGQTIVTSYQTQETYLALIVLGSAFFIMLISISLFFILKKRFEIQREIISTINGDVNDRINALKLLKITGTLEYEKKRFKDIHRDFYYASMKTVRIRGLIFALVFTAFNSLNIITLLASIQFVNEQKLNPTIMIAFTMAINALIFPMIQMIQLLGNLAQASTSANRVNNILNGETKIDFNKNAKSIEALNGNIIFKNVSLTYDDESKKIKSKNYILNNFNYDFKEGLSYAIVGESGVGKTTITNLLLRLYDPTKGKIIINNKNLKNINLKSYLDQVGFVEQEPKILYGDFFENISYGNFKATEEEIVDAAKKAHIYKFIMSLPNQFKTLVGENGFILSGGQKQRIVIARMFLKNPRLLILDEATSALDNIVEKSIQKELDTLMQNRTTIIIAHRLTTIKNVDKILVLKKNKGVIQEGTFEELKNRKGLFQILYKTGFENI